MDFDWILIGIGFVGLVCAVVQWVRGGFADGSDGSVVLDGSMGEVGR